MEKKKRKVGGLFPEEAVGNWSYMGNCKGSLKGEVRKGRGKGFQEKHSDLKKEKNREKEEGKKEEIGRGENRETRVGEKQRETVQEVRNDWHGEEIFWSFWVEREVPVKWVLRSKTRKKQNRGGVKSNEHLEVWILQISYSF